jgi:hypothetical protein
MDDDKKEKPSETPKEKLPEPDPPSDDRGTSFRDGWRKPRK